MQSYANLSGSSGVVAFEISTGAIKVRFKDGDCYLYNEIRPGAAPVRQMTRLARAGAGLSTYISQHVRERYFSKC